MTTEKLYHVVVPGLSEGQVDEVFYILHKANWALIIQDGATPK